MPVERPLPDDDRLSETRVQLCFGEPFGVGLQVEEIERVVGADAGRLLDEAARVDVPVDPRASPHREVVAAVATDPERGVELVVAVVRPTGGTRIRVLLGGRGRSVLVLDLDVDSGVGHGRSLDRSSPAAGYSRSSGSESEAVRQPHEGLLVSRRSDAGR